MFRQVCGIDGSNEVILATRNGKAIRFNESRVRSMGRTAAGVLGVRLDKGDKVDNVSFSKIKLN